MSHLLPRALTRGRRPPGLGAYLAGLIVLAVLPLILAATLAMTRIAERTERDFRTAREEVAHALALALDSHIERLKPLLRSLSRAPVAAGDNQAELPAFHDRLVRLGQELDTPIWVQGNDPARPWLLASTLPFGVVPPGPLPKDIAALRTRAEASRQPELDNLIDHSPLLGRPVARLVMPVYRGDTPAGAVGMLLPPEGFQKILTAQRFAPTEFATLIDGRARIVASSVGHEAKLGKSHPAWLPIVIGDSDGGTVVGPAYDGTQVLISYARLPHSPSWIVGVVTPHSAYSASQRGPWVVFGLGCLVSLVATATGGFVLSRQLLRPLARVTARAEALAEDAPLPPATADAGARVDQFLRLEEAVAHSHARLLAEAREARQQQALLESVTESSTDAIFVKDLEGRYRLANGAAAVALGHPQAAVIGRTDADLMPNAAATFSASDQAVLAQGLPGTFEEQVLDADGTRRQVWQAAKAPWRDAATGEILGVVGVSRDVTEQLRDAARLRETERSLQTLARRATISAMASGMAHELSQPLTAAANYLHVAATVAERDGSGALAPLRLGREQVVRAGAILQQIRHFLRRDDAGRQPSSVPELVEGAVNLVLGALEGPAPGLHFEADPGLPLLQVNPVQAQQVVVNLVRNACEAMESLPPEAQRRLSITVEAAPEGAVAVTIADTGPGVPEEILATLFEPFRSTKPDGSGIGLAICRAIVESHGGRITLGPAPGGGTQVRFTLAGSVE